MPEERLTVIDLVKKGFVLITIGLISVVYLILVTVFTGIVEPRLGEVGIPKWLIFVVVFLIGGLLFTPLSRLISRLSSFDD